MKEQRGILVFWLILCLAGLTTAAAQAYTVTVQGAPGGLRAVAAGGLHTLALRQDGTVLAWGYDGAGQSTVPDNLAAVSAIAAGAYHSVALKDGGTVLAWGADWSGQASVPEGLTGVTAIAAGAAHSVALKGDGTVLAWGDNEHGQTAIPQGLAGVTAIAAGANHTVALKTDGTVLAWGLNDHGQSAVPEGLAGVTTIAAGANHSLALKADGTVVAWGGTYQTAADGQTSNPALVPAGLTGVIAIAAGSEHSVALKADGSLVAWGRNNYQQNSIPAGLSRVTAISAGHEHSVALQADGGALVAWGGDGAGQCTMPAALATPIGHGTISCASPVAPAGDSACAIAPEPGFHLAVLTANGQLLKRAVQNNQYTFTNVQNDLTVMALFAADAVPDAPRIDTVTPGNGQATVSFAPAWHNGRAITSYTVTVSPGGHLLSGVASPLIVSGLSNGTPYAFTLIASNDLGAGPPSLPVSGVLPSPGPPTINSISTAANQATVFFTPHSDNGGEVTTFTVTASPGGRTASGATSPLTVTGLDNGVTYSFTATVSDGLSVSPPSAAMEATTPYPVTVRGPLSGVSAIAAGWGHTVALKGDGTLIAWGGEEESAIPDGLSGVTAIAARARHTLALLANGTVTGWGLNDNGALAIPAELSGVSAIATGEYHSVALKQDGTVVAWGDNRHGQAAVPAGLSEVRAIATGFYHTVALKQDGTVVAWGYDGAGESTIPAGLTGVTKIAVGASHTLALLANGTVLAWGDNVSGQINVPAGLSGVTAIAAGYYHSFALKADGAIAAWGENAAGQSTVPQGLGPLSAVAGGYYHSAALRADGTVTAWGENYSGQITVPAGTANDITHGALACASPALGGNALCTATPDPDYHLALLMVNGVDRLAALRNNQITITGIQSAQEVIAAFAVNTVPEAPAGVSATPGHREAQVSFTPPPFDGGSPIFAYTATAHPGGVSASSDQSPITVAGLSNGADYTFTVTATNAVGTGPASAPSASVRLPPDPPLLSGTTPTKRSRPTWNWTAGAVGGNGHFRFKLDSPDLTTGATLSTASTFTPAIALGLGSHTLHVQEQDAAGLWSASARFTIVIVPTDKGDSNGDGVLGLIDAVLLLKSLSGLPPAAPIFIEADTDGDQRFTASDAVFILRHIAAGQ